MTDFKNMDEVLNHTKEVLVLDLLEHVAQIPEEDYDKVFVKYEPGLYYMNSVEPIFKKNAFYYPKSQYPKEAFKTKDVSALILMKEPIVDEEGKFVFDPINLILRKKYIHDKPTVPSVGIKVAVSVVQMYLQSICRYASSKHSLYKIDKLVNPEYHHLIDNEEFSHIFENLIDRISSFVKNDDWSMYFVSLKGSNIVIEKGLDWRIHEWYRIQFEQSEEDENNNKIT